jgi:(1->4)-alpha-D-glucan 1-alpha-D-glucosylmutase
MRIPIATYRIQFNSQFGFKDAQKIASYLSNLGISDLYASPIFKARAGSTHGYDVVDPNQFNPELGTAEMFEELVNELRSHNMGWVQDIVPNHMAYDSQNQYLMNVMEYGPDSDYVDYFDICWNSPYANSQERLLAPLLGNFYGVCLVNGEIQLKYQQDGLSVNYYGLSLPLRLESYVKFLTQDLGKLNRTLGRNHPDFIKLLGILYLLKNLTPEVSGRQRQDQVLFVKQLLWESYNNNQDIKTFVDENIKVFNGEAGKQESFHLLDGLLNEQFYRLAFWKVGAEEINYRRFFTVNELISVKVEEIRVFNNTHAFIRQLVESGQVTGLRVDHIDGLYHPTQYLDRLREKMGDVYITVEKILDLDENLSTSWPVQGTSGYDFLNYVNGVFCHQSNHQKFIHLYQNLTGRSTSYEQLVQQNKRLILERNLAGDVDNLAYLLRKLSDRYLYGNDFTINGLKRAIAEVLTLFPVYRTYVNEAGINEVDRTYTQSVIATARENAPALIHELNFIEKLLLLEFEPSLTQTEKDQWLYFVMRLQQYTGPLMAKGVEDTTLYVYNCLAALNEVGGNPSRFGVSLAEFHEFNYHRQTKWAYAMSATATHDTKRGEDVRARLNVLSELPEAWAAQVKLWQDINRQYKGDRDGLSMPDANDEYLFYQTLIGALPFQAQERQEFIQRMKDYMIKAIREAKVHTAWLRPDDEYENSCIGFVDQVLQPANSLFWKKFAPFQQQIATYGIYNSLSQVVLKMCAPGIPDFYQGTELWDFSLVDPDNRRPVDFELRRTYLHDVQQGINSDVLTLIADLLKNKTDGKIKLFLTTQMLKTRATQADLFLQGDYLPLKVEGKYKVHVIAFAKRYEQQMAIAIVPRFLSSLIQPEELPLGESVWQDTQINLPQAAGINWQNAITHQALQTDGQLRVGQALQHFPVALLFNGL